MKTVVTLALKAGAKAQSAQTGFIHFQDRIPLYENLCYVLALFRSHLSDQILEGRALLEKIMHFEVEGHFPLFLHEYPHCRDPRSTQKMAPIFFWLMRDFSSLLGENLKRKIASLQERIPSFSLTQHPITPNDWADYLIAVQMLDEEKQPPYLEKVYREWHPILAAFQGPQPHRKTQPLPSLLDLFMGELHGFFSGRALEEGNWHLEAALVQPFTWQPLLSQYLPFILRVEKELFLAWGGRDYLHTFVTFNHLRREGDYFFIDLPLELPQEQENEELIFYCNFHSDHQLLVNGCRATTFQMGDQVQILSKNIAINLQFEGEGVFFGHLSKTNRPHQPKMPLEAHDWKIALRTLRRESHCTIKIMLQVEQREPCPLHASHCLHRQWTL